MIENDSQRERVRQAFPPIADSPREFQSMLFQASSLVNTTAGSRICAVGDRCSALALLLSGTARVYKLSEAGREITLYRIETGGTCVLTASCIISDLAFPALADVEEAGEALLVPPACVKAGVEIAEPWRRFMFGLVARRLADTMAVVEEVAFKRMDERIARLLLKRLQNRREISATHQQIASELGTSRVVISRILKDFEVKGAIRMSRGRIELLDAARLAGVGE